MRLTKWRWFRTNKRLYRANNKISVSDLTWKLGQLEDIEEELGVDLVMLFKILRTGGHIWVKNCKGINEWHIESLKQRGLDGNWYLTYSNNVRVKLKDYGKTWALTSEELL